MRRDLQARERVGDSGIPGHGGCPGASARGCYAAGHYGRKMPISGNQPRLTVCHI